MSQADWDAASSAALALFAHGQAEAAQRGLLLVDTKYELGKDAEGNILLLDEVSRSLCCSSASASVYGIERHATMDS
jgi:phosphoribosylaminoimidazole-succinocarboxamide synthase